MKTVVNSVPKLPSAGKPFRALVTPAAEAGNALPAQERKVTLHTRRHRAEAAEVAIGLVVHLAVPDVRA